MTTPVEKINALSNLDCSSQINLSKYRKLINESKQRCRDLIDRSSLLSTSNKKETNAIMMIGNREELECLSTMKKLADYVLYDFGSLSDYKQYLTTSGNKSIDRKCQFDLDDKERGEINYLATELDSIECELVDISRTIERIRSSYKSYNEKFLRLCDQKDVLFEAFLDYYAEYFLVDEFSNSDSAKKPVVTSSGRTRKKSTNMPNRTSTRSRTRGGSRSVSAFGGAKTVQEAASKRQNSTARVLRRSLRDENVNEEEEEGDKRKPNRRASIYVYSVPTENRFSILSKSERGTLLKHY